MPQAPRTTPFDGTDRLIIDGTNLLYRLGTGSGGAAPASAIVGRIRGAVPLTIAIDLVFDGVGHGVYGRLAQKMVVRYSGRRAADDTILDLVSEATMHGGGPAAADHVLVVTNDRGLRDHLAAKGARTAPRPVVHRQAQRPGPVDDGHGVTPAGDRGGAATRHGRPGRQRGWGRGSQGLEARPRGDRQVRDPQQGRPPQASPARPGLTTPAHPRPMLPRPIRPARVRSGPIRPRTCARALAPVSICA